MYIFSSTVDFYFIFPVYNNNYLFELLLIIFEPVLMRNLVSCRI